jgi:hypothetical protein
METWVSHRDLIHLLKSIALLLGIWVLKDFILEEINLV